jgi:hypothetical protein
LVPTRLHGITSQDTEFFVVANVKAASFLGYELVNSESDFAAHRCVPVSDETVGGSRQSSAMQESTFFVCTHVRGLRLTAVCYSELTGPSSASGGTSHVEMLPYTMKRRVSVHWQLG